MKRMKRAAISTAAAVVMLTQAGFTAGYPVMAAEASQQAVQAATALHVLIKRQTGGLISVPNPFIVNGNSMAPSRPLLEKMGFVVRWDGENRQVIAQKEGLYVELPVGSREAKINGKHLTMPVATISRAGTAYVPVKFLAEADGREVVWDGGNRTVLIHANQEAMKLRIVTRLDNFPDHMSDMATYLDKLAGAKFDIISIPSEHYQEKINVMIAAGDLPDLMLVPDLNVYGPDLVPSVFWDLSPYLSAYSNLSKLVDEAGDRLWTKDGKIYGIPRLSPLYEGTFPVIRKDWLDKLGLAEPKTMEELYEVLKRFAEQDPDGNGRNDTVGLTGSADRGGLGNLGWALQVFNGNNGRFTLQNGQVKDSVFGTQTRDSLLWLHKAYSDGLIDKEFPIIDAGQAAKRFSDGKAGVYAMKLSDVAGMQEQLQQSDPSASLLSLVSLRSPSGDEVFPGSDGSPSSTEVFAIPRFATKEKVNALLSLLDRAAALSTEAKEKLPKNIEEPFKAIFGSTDVGGSAPTSELRQQLEAVVKARGEEKPSDVQAGLPFTSINQRAASAQFDNTIVQMMIKVVVGAASIEQWDTFSAELQSEEDYKQMLQQFIP